MLRKIMLSLLFGAVVAGPVIAQEPTAQEDRAFDLAVQNYHEALAMRSGPPAHYETVRNAMDVFDGRVIVEAFLGDQFYRMMWNADLGNVLITRSGEEIPIITYIDEYGRSAFALGDLSGWLDVLGIELHVQVTTPGGDAYRWEGDLPSETNEGDGPVLIPTRKKECLCKGSNVKCSGGAMDCQGNQPCTLPDGTPSWCKWLHMTVKQPKNPPQGGCISGKAESLLLLGLLGSMTFCPPVRRRLIRRVRTQR